jgi:hypothetical protein
MKFQMAEMTPAEAAKFVRQIAETSQDWTALEAVIESVILSAMDAGRKYGQTEVPERKASRDLHSEL